MFRIINSETREFLYREPRGAEREGRWGVSRSQARTYDSTKAAQVVIEECIIAFGHKLGEDLIVIKSKPWSNGRKRRQMESLLREHYHTMRAFKTEWKET